MIAQIKASDSYLDYRQKMKGLDDRLFMARLYKGAMRQKTWLKNRLIKKNKDYVLYKSVRNDPKNYYPQHDEKGRYICGECNSPCKLLYKGYLSNKWVCKKCYYEKKVVKQNEISSPNPANPGDQ